MSLKPTQRLKKRYIHFTFSGDSTKDELSRAIHLYALNFFGEYGLSKRTIKLLEFNGREGILLVERGALEEVLGMLALITEVNDRPARITADATSGTMKALRDKEKA